LSAFAPRLVEPGPLKSGRPEPQDRVAERSLAPIAFHSAVPVASLICADDFGAASYISPPP